MSTDFGSASNTGTPMNGKSGLLDSDTYRGTMGDQPGAASRMHTQEFNEDSR